MAKLQTAIAFGADAVYAGIPDFSLRARVNDFDIEQLREATEYCHVRDKKIYVTLNLVAHNRHLAALKKHIAKLKSIGVDALIISDPGVLMLVRELWPEAVIHLSTQANCCNWQSARFWYELGVKRIVLGRETSLPEIREIHAKLPDLELEYFVHGAMCMSYSGRCFLSKHFRDRSANLGDCVQPCRWEYQLRIKNEELRIDSLAPESENLDVVEDNNGSHILNSKDLRLLRYLRDLASAGVTSFKIEGRAKSAYYQAMVTGIYASALKKIYKRDEKSIAFFEQELDEKLTHRGYTSGFLLGERADQETRFSHTRSEWEFCGQVYSIKNEKLKIKNHLSQTVLVRVHNSLKVGDEIEIVRPKYDVLKMRVEKMFDVKSGEELGEAHGGQDFCVLLPVSEEVPEFSVIRRRTIKN